MPTIDQLPSAAAMADDDLVAISQGGSMKQVRRSQVVAGLQPALSVTQGGVLGRWAAGSGQPETIAIGANLRLRDGILAGPDPFTVGGLPPGGAVRSTDLVSVSQGGRDAAVPVGMLLGCLSRVPGLDLSSQVVRVPGGVPRSLSASLEDLVPVEAFGAVGDGAADDTAAVLRALMSGQPIRFGPRTYVVNGQVTITRAAVMVGVPGETVLLRTAQTGGAWFAVQGPRFSARGIVFDAGRVGVESWGVLVEATCQESWFEGCWFRGASGATLGCGLVIGARDGTSGGESRHVVRGCRASGNAAHGIWVQAASGAVVEGCVAHENGVFGICLDFNDPTFQQQVRHCVVSGCEAYANARGISIGNFNETNLEPPRWGLANPDAVGISVLGNRCHGNVAYGIAVSGAGLLVSGNIVEGNGSGLLVSASTTLVSGNVVRGPGQYGIDAGGSADCDITENLVSGYAVGINPGGSQNVRVAGNGLSQNVWAVTAYAVETDGRGVPFGLACVGLTIEANRIWLKDGSGGGVLLADGPRGTAVMNNRFWGGSGSVPSQALWAHTDQVSIRGNSWNNETRAICNPIDIGGRSQIQVPDVLDEAMVTSAPRIVASIMGQHQASVAGQVTFIRVMNGGHGYTTAAVTISGSGTGANAVGLVRDGAVIGIAVQSGGSGYGAADAIVTITGDGVGAVATAMVGLPIGDGRQLRLHCNSPVRFQRAGSVPFQDNWTGSDVLVPSASVVDWIGAWGGWQAVAFPLADYVAPAGDGAVAIRSLAGDVVVRPAGSGRVRVASDGEAAGYSSLLGRGSPEGTAVAPPGSDFRNLDGGLGTTLWIKRNGAGSTGWAAVA